MPTKTSPMSARIDAITSVLAPEHQKAVAKALQEVNGDLSSPDLKLPPDSPRETLDRLKIADVVGTALGDLPEAAGALAATLLRQPGIGTLRDLARLNPGKLTALIAPDAKPDTEAFKEAQTQATALINQCFVHEPLTVLQRMTDEREIPTGSDGVRNGLNAFLRRIPADADIRTTPVRKWLTEDALADVPEDHRAGVIDQARALWRSLAIAPPDAPQVPPILMKQNLSSAFHVSEKPESAFLRLCGAEMGEDTARRVHANAVAVRARNEHALMALREAVRWAGPYALNGKQNLEAGKRHFQKAATKNDVQLNLDSLFGDMDHCECKECESVYSASAYFVELLEFLRNNNLGPDPDTGLPPVKNPHIHAGIAGTPLEKLFERRPDLGDFELSCENTNTLLPYVDLVNEVMESFVVNRAAWASTPPVPKLDAFNVAGETSEELLAQPQHTNHMAYCVLKNEAVHPFTLPFHQPIEAARIFLKYLGTSRHELIDTFRSAHEVVPDTRDTSRPHSGTFCCQEEGETAPSIGAILHPTRTGSFDPATAEFHETVLGRAVDAEFLGLTQEEYIILAREAFWPKAYFETTKGRAITSEEYRQNIGVKPPWEYYGYATESALMDANADMETGRTGLSFVKKAFLPRTGIQFTDLVDLLKTRFVNPAQPKGLCLAILESTRSSYRFLQTKVNPDSTITDPKTKYADLIAFLESSQAWESVPQVQKAFRPASATHKAGIHRENPLLRRWVYGCFERIGKLIILDCGGGPQLPLHGTFPVPRSSAANGGEGVRTEYTLRADGTIVDGQGQRVGKVSVVLGPGEGGGSVAYAGPVEWADGRTFAAKFGKIGSFRILDDTGQLAGFISSVGPLDVHEKRVRWTSPGGGCNLDEFRLLHLDGTAVTVEEFDRMQRFIRLWRKLGWTMDEVDNALAGLATTGTDSSLPPGEDVKPHVEFEDFEDTCCPSGELTGCCGDGPAAGTGKWDITPEFLHQLVAVRTLMERSGLPLPNLLVFWADIGVTGEKSLFAKLFLSRSMLAIDNVFQADDSGNYLTRPAKVSEHLPVLMAAFKLKADAITTIVGLIPGHDTISSNGAPDADLSLANISFIYRHTLLARALGIRATDLKDLKTLFGNPFGRGDVPDADATFKFFELWKKMADNGFTFRQLAYVIKGDDDPLKPFAPSKQKLLQFAKILYDGLTAIDVANPDPVVTDPGPTGAGPSASRSELATTELVRAKAGMLFDALTVEKIVGLLEGTAIYATNAPPDQDIQVPDELAKRIRYIRNDDANPHQASLQVTGILSPSQKEAAIELCDDSDWAKAFNDRIDSQNQVLFDDVLSALLPEDKLTEAKAILLAGDMADPEAPEKGTAPPKRGAFLGYFLPYLRKQLKHRFILDTVSGMVGLPRDQVEVLLSCVRAGTADAEMAEDVLASVQDALVGAAWFLIPPEDGDYCFAAVSLSEANGVYTRPGDVRIDGTLLPFTQQKDPSNLWSTGPVSRSPVGNPLKKGQLYKLEVADRLPAELLWKKSGSSWNPIPASALLPDFIGSDAPVSPFQTVFDRLFKSAILVNGFPLSADEILFFHLHGPDFGKFDFNLVTLESWERVADYVALRKSLPSAGTPLLELFAWAAAHPDDPAKLAKKLDDATRWGQDRIAAMITPSHFDLASPEKFKNEVCLVRMQKAISVSDKVGVDIDRLFYWAVPGSKFWACHAIAQDIRMTLRGRFTEEKSWEQAIQPLNDRLREMQKQALIAFLLTQPPLKEWGVADADGLFEFFLIDVQMGPARQTSRMVQAIAAVQLFIKRCLMGLEDRKGSNGSQDGVPADAIDRDRWEWMQKYRVWEANRKVFLYPENWIRPELRDDKSPFYRELESELLQKDINTQTIRDALLNYIFKVDEVANLQVVGLHIEGCQVARNPKAIGPQGFSKLHIFARTRHAPYYFYYRYFELADGVTGDWHPWEKMQIDIPSYSAEEVYSEQQKRTSPSSGSYLVPVVFEGRLIVFFPEIIKKTRSNQAQTSKTFNDLGYETDGIQKAAPVEFYEVKMAWSEYRNGKWTQKQVSSEAVNSCDKDARHKIENFKFVSIIETNKIDICFDDFHDHDGGYRGTFSFDGRSLIVCAPRRSEEMPIDRFNMTGGDTIYSWQLDPSGQRMNQDIHSIDSGNSTRMAWSGRPGGQVFTDSKADGPLSDANNSEKMPFDRFITTEGGTIYSWQLDPSGLRMNQDIHFIDSGSSSRMVWGGGAGEQEFTDSKTNGWLRDANKPVLDGFFQSQMEIPEGERAATFGGFGTVAGIFNELRQPHSLYSWEAWFHAPMQLADQLLKSQQFDRALAMCRYVFDPLAKPAPDESITKSCWRFLPFKHVDARNVLETLMASLKPGQWNSEINRWRSNEFMPHVVARSRPSAYMKYVVAKNIEILIEYGDYYFRQYTTESIPLAIQCYVMASHLYGPRGQRIPRLGKKEKQTYNSLLDRWDAFGNAVVDLELEFPFYSQFAMDTGSAGAGFPGVFGTTSSLYFGIPDNPDLTALRDRIDDRLLKIRSCENIEGVFSQPPLFDPPIDPALLVQAAAQGLSLAGILSDLDAPMPNYRFCYLLQKALELCGELKALGNTFLSMKEKGDAEALSNLRATHERVIQNFIMEVKKLQLEESTKSLEALKQNRLGSVSRMQHYLLSINEELSKVPQKDSDFSELPNQFGSISDESGLKVNQYEKEEIEKACEAQDWQTAIGKVETLGSILNLIPQVSVDGKPIGIGAGTEIGGVHFGAAVQAVARGMQVHASNLSFQSSHSARKAGFLRQLQDRIQQANAAGYEIKNIDKQILTQQIRIAIANLEIGNQQKQIDNARDVEEFLRTKYTNVELYSWMDGELRTLYRQAYNLAYDLAKKAEKAYRFERPGDISPDFIQYGYWDAGRDGLMSGERLHLALKQLEAAYQQNRGYDFEITRHISLRQVDPLALIELRENGTCEFELPETLFDMDYPGHYMRRIKSVALTLPCVVGAYTSLNCTLRLLRHEFRISPLSQDYPKKSDEDDPRFRTIHVPISAIAVSSGQNDSGAFELNFRDERYIPFEGAGVISQWRLELPDEFRQFDYRSISDAVLHVRYTANEGGDLLRKEAIASFKAFLKNSADQSQEGPLAILLSLRRDFPKEWAASVASAVPGVTLNATITKAHFPYFAQDDKNWKITISDINVIENNSVLYQATEGNDVGVLTKDLNSNGVCKVSVRSDLFGHGQGVGDKYDSDGEVHLLIHYTLDETRR